MSEPTQEPVPSKDTVELTFNWHFEVNAGAAVFFLDGKEVFRSVFNEANLADALYQKTKSQNIYLRLSDGQRQRIFVGLRERLAAEGIEPTDEDIEALMPQALLVMGQRLQKQSIDQAAHQIQEELPKVLLGMLTDITHGTLFSGANRLRDTLNVPDQKYTEKDVKQALFEPAWERIKTLFNVVPSSQGGARNIKHNWTDQDCACLAAKYEELKPVWVDAKEIAREAQKSKIKNRKLEWRQEVLRTYSSLPSDLIEHLATMRGGTKPSDLALLHASRLCGITPGLSTKRLREKIKEWKIKTNVEVPPPAQ